MLTSKHLLLASVFSSSPSKYHMRPERSLLLGLDSHMTWRRPLRRHKRTEFWISLCFVIVVFCCWQKKSDGEVETTAALNYWRCSSESHTLQAWVRSPLEKHLKKKPFMVHAPTKPTCFLSSYAILIHFAKLPAVFPHPVASTLLPVSCKHLPPPTVNCLPLSSQHANGLDEILILGDLWRCSQAKKHQGMQLYYQF